MYKYLVLKKVKWVIWFLISTAISLILFVKIVLYFFLFIFTIYTKNIIW